MCFTTKLNDVLSPESSPPLEPADLETSFENNLSD
jgi:hypothetical protein